LQHHLLSLLHQLHCPNYIKVVILNLLLLYWLKVRQHPCWTALQSTPEAFSEEKGESSLALLARARLSPSNPLQTCQQHYGRLPYCRQICEAFKHSITFYNPTLLLATPDPAVSTALSKHWLHYLDRMTRLPGWKGLIAFRRENWYCSDTALITLRHPFPFITYITLSPAQLNITVAFLNNGYFLQNNWGQEY